jgi:hypothetical protein
VTKMLAFPAIVLADTSEAAELRITLEPVVVCLPSDVPIVYVRLGDVSHLGWRSAR